MKKGIILAVVFCFLAIPGLSFAMGLEAAVGIWRQKIDGETSYKRSSRSDVLDLGSDFNVDDQNRFMGRVKIDMPAILPNIYVMATQMEFEGTGSKDVNFNFGSISIDADAPFEGSLAMNHVDMCLYYSIPFLNLATLNSLNIDLGINLKIADLEGKVTDKTTGLSDSDSYVLPIPMLFAGIQIKPIDSFAIEAEVRYVSLSGNHLYGLIGRIKSKVFGPIFLAGGYRYDSIKLDEQNHLLDFSISGLFVETGFQF